MTKHTSFYVSIHTDEGGYSVQRQKYFSARYDKAVQMDMKAEIDKWIAKMGTKALSQTTIEVDVIGNGTDSYFRQQCIIRFIKHNWEDKAYKVIWFGDDESAQTVYELDSKKDAVAEYNRLYRNVADHIHF